MGAETSCAACKSPDARFKALAEARDLAGLEAVAENDNLEKILETVAEHENREEVLDEQEIVESDAQAYVNPQEDLKAPDINLPPADNAEKEIMPLQVGEVQHQPDGLADVLASVPDVSNPQDSSTATRPPGSHANNKAKKPHSKARKKQQLVSSGTTRARRSGNDLLTSSHAARERPPSFTKEDLERRKQMWREEEAICLQVFMAKEAQIQKQGGTTQSGLEMMGELMNSFARDVAANRKMKAKR
mmetsp:Transcript_123252/g.237631  ORF Transcript_123252/g.237631 Transcript_123252/m.237631 type:complete len:246 (-) Transcript_123252:48-785(-)